MRLPRAPWSFGSGPAVGSAFARAFAVISLVAWLSLGVQVSVLIGSHGLLPVADFMEAVRAEPGVTVFDLPTLLWWFHSDRALIVGVALGATLSIAALLGFRRRVCFALSTALYLSFATVARDFMSFQWDNLLLECGLLAAFLRTDRPAPVVHFLFRVVLFKLYFESGVAKWQSPIHDWQDGSAMTYYYETAPLPTWLAWRAHHLPVWWHHVESWATLFVELVVPFAIFGPRRARLFAAAAFTLFQVGNAATANYGFFCYLALALHLFLLDDQDVVRAQARLAPLVPDRVQRWIAARRGRRSPPPPPPDAAESERTPAWAAWAGAAAFVVVSGLDGLYHFSEPGALLAAARPILAINQRLRLVNSYHLFASVTRERIEPELQTLDAPADDPDAAPDEQWSVHDLRHKPGDVARPPDFVAPHQPRVDFQLWFYGLSFQRRQPTYVSTLLERICEDAPAVQSLFRAPLPRQPAAARLVFWRYQFTSPAEASTTGAWWRRERVAASRAFTCPH
jgi:hypothetical protein